MKFFLPVFFLTLALQVKAQYPKIIVQFKDKGNNTFSLSQPSAYLSHRAIDRRKRYNIPFDSTDLPVSKAYLDSIFSTGDVKVLNESKWLNQILIQTTDQQAIKKILSFAFVKSARGMGYRMPNSGRSGNSKKPIIFSNLPVAARPVGTTADIYNYGSNYNQVHIHEGEFLHNKGFRGETMQIAVLDAGFLQYKSNTAFDSARSNGQIKGERDFVAGDNSVNEDDSHGMYCLSILTANWPGKMVGTSPKAGYWLVRTENAASEYPIEEHNWVAGAEFADSCGADLISSSLGYIEFEDSSFNHTYADFYKRKTMVSIGASMAVKKGMIVTASAGNEGNSNWKYLVFPADTDSVCTVGSVNNSGVISGFSSYGYLGNQKPNIVSVGEGTVIAGLNDQPATGNGTSFSNPNIAGLIACLWQAFPAATNMQILDAVYKSADRYTAPDNRYGNGIPNFRIAYHLLKHLENIALYGDKKFFVTPNPFTTRIDTKFISGADGTASVQLINAAGQVVASQSILTEKEEIYNYSFVNLASLPVGFYSVKYSDSTFTETVSIQKGNIFEKDWLLAAPNPFRDNLIVYLKSPVSGEISLRLIDAKGSVVKTLTEKLTENEIRVIPFKNSQELQSGVYFLQYISKTQKRIIRLIKQ